MRAVGREPAEGGIPVELISYQSLGHREKFSPHTEFTIDSKERGLYEESYCI